jgi:hypothetical protein
VWLDVVELYSDDDNVVVVVVVDTKDLKDLILEKVEVVVEGVVDADVVAVVDYNLEEVM